MKNDGKGRISMKKRRIGLIAALLAVLLLAGMGLASMAWAVFADVGVMVLAVLNAMRALKP